MTRFTTDELQALAATHVAVRPDRLPAPGVFQLVRNMSERDALRRFAATPSYDDAAGRRALLPTYADLPGLPRLERSARVEWARKTRRWVVSTQETPAPDVNEPPIVHGRFRSLSEAMDRAVQEARYIVHPTRPQEEA